MTRVRVTCLPRLVLSLAIMSCGDGGASRPDAAVLDAAVIDGAVIDGAIDGAVIDGAVIDGAVIDGAVIDGAVIDGAVIDAALVDAVQLDASPPDAMVCRELVCGVTRLAPTGDLDTRGLASDGTHVYWSNDRAGLSRVPVGGGAVEPIAADQVPSGGFSPGSDVALDATHIYWAFRDSGTVWRRAKAGGPTELLITGQDGINRLALTATEVLWTNDLLDNVMRMPKAGGAPVAIATGQTGAYDLAVDATHVYWADQLGQGLRRAPLAGGAVETLVPGGAPRMLALDATDVYWLDEATEEIFRRPKAGGATVTLVTGVGTIYGFAIDGTNLYWTTDDVVSRRPKTLASAAVALASCFPDIYAPYLLRVQGATLYWATRYLNAADGIQQVPAQATCL
ncbi:MAG: hypothetical protein KBG48_14180 [Kofleriaceae bacterium]|nr:hypothetical protein [Kofleriaceae bacterium]MBP9168539.1 hypothetical protein [Kofleriaceae bacterium]MBP9859752.1 hypothetical protein [Kofleriaceae bacterium]